MVHLGNRRKVTGENGRKIPEDSTLTVLSSYFQQFLFWEYKFTSNFWWFQLNYPQYKNKLTLQGNSRIPAYPQTSYPAYGRFLILSFWGNKKSAAAEAAALG